MSVAAVATVLAHQGGWDEILMVAGPLLAIAALLVIAKRRATALAAERAAAAPTAPTPDSETPADR